MDKPANTPLRGRPKRRLRPLQMEHDLQIALRLDPGDVLVPALARVNAEFLRGDVTDTVPGANDIGGGKRLAIVPFHARPELQRQVGARFVPRPLRCQFRADRIGAVLRDVLIVQHQIVEHAHHRREYRVAGLLVNGHVAGAVAMQNTQNAAVPLGHGGCRQHYRGQRQQKSSQHEGTLPVRLFRLVGRYHTIRIGGGQATAAILGSCP